MEIRQAKKKDRKSLFEFYKPIWKEKSKEETDKILDHNFKKENTLIIAEENGKIIGRTAYGPFSEFRDKEIFPKKLVKKNICMSFGLLVKPSRRSEGIGKTLKRAAFTQASKKFNKMYATVTKGNTISLKIQKKLGLTRKGSYKTRKGETRIIFEKDLRKNS